jgi:RNA polymerase sigma-70 factor (ECF subfamily)
VAALDTLSPSVRAAFVLCRFENLTQAEAAARLGLSVSTIEKHMMTALARLRLAIGTEHDA